MAKKLLRPMTDVVFHALFREENKKLLEGLIEDILGEKVKVISTDKDRHVMIKNPEEKLGIMDLRTELEGGIKCNIEIQLAEEQYEKERMLYYWAETYTRQLLRGEEYSELKKTISIIILNHDIEPIKELENLGTKWQIRDSETGQKVLTDRLEIVIISIPKAERMYKKNEKDKIGQWMMFLSDPNKKEVGNIMKENEKIKEAVEELEEISDDYTLRRIAELREKGRRDYNAAISFATEKGKEQKNKEIAKKMLESGIPIEKIEAITGLTKDEIESI